jgi:hypothetical protein
MRTRLAPKCNYLVAFPSNCAAASATGGWWSGISHSIQLYCLDPGWQISDNIYGEICKRIASGIHKSNTPTSVWEVWSPRKGGNWWVGTQRLLTHTTEVDEGMVSIGGSKSFQLFTWHHTLRLFASLSLTWYSCGRSMPESLLRPCGPTTSCRVGWTQPNISLLCHSVHWDSISHLGDCRCGLLGAGRAVSSLLVPHPIIKLNNFTYIWAAPPTKNMQVRQNGQIRQNGQVRNDFFKYYVYKTKYTRCWQTPYKICCPLVTPSRHQLIILVVSNVLFYSSSF